jgi:hypothetical protein
MGNPSLEPEVYNVTPGTHPLTPETVHSIPPSFVEERENESGERRKDENRRAKNPLPIPHPIQGRKRESGERGNPFSSSIPQFRNGKLRAENGAPPFHPPSPNLGTEN